MARIVLVDDSPFHLKVYSNKLKERNYEIETYDAASQALSAVLANPPDLLVSDIVMPEMTGVELCAKVRERLPKEQLPILLVSSLDSMDVMVGGYEAGADDYLVKPVNTEEFHAKVALLLRQRRAQEQVRKTADEAGQPPRHIIDRYEILDLLGEGAYGSVYKARRLGCEALVALKVLSRAKLTKNTIGRFLRESTMLKTLGAVPGIAAIIDVGHDGEHYYYAMELVAGITIRKHLEKHGPLGEQQGLAIARGMASVLEALRRADIIHRDIKPDNIVIDPGCRPTLIDFGLARLQDNPTVTQRHEVPGTPAYIAPEAIRGEKVDSRSDLYSLGVTLFESLTGRLPYEGANSLFTLIKIAEGTLPNFEPLIDSNISPGFTAVIERLLCGDPEARYQTAEELIEELNAFE